MGLSNIEILNEYFSTESRNILYQTFYIALSAYNSLLEEKKEFKESVFFSNIRTRLLTFMIYRQFDKDLLSEEYPFKVITEKVNNFGYTSLILHKNNINISLANTNKKGKLPNKSKYRIKYSRFNTLYDVQLRFKIDESGENEIIDAPIFFIIGYKVYGGKFSYLNLMLPDNRMKNSLQNIDLTLEYNNWLNQPINQEDEEYIEKTIAKLKESAIRELSINN